jgi:hypothetical protein
MTIGIGISSERFARVVKQLPESYKKNLLVLYQEYIRILEGRLN